MAGPLPFALHWTPNPSATSQTVKFRERGNTDWVTNVNINDPNPQAAITTDAIVQNAAANTVYQFQIDAICPSGPGHSAIMEMIRFEQQELTMTVSGGNNLNVNQSAMASVVNIEYQLYNSLDVVVATTTTTGINPIANFLALASDDYYFKYRYSAVINGVTLWSDDATQEGAYYISGTVTIP